ncbi:Ammonia monooxygenase gamma subunit [Georgfuchsia toluolica]|uniref:Ammonia monooxygenase gamma subunit n=1 Tax=Georgfuchsia toluolica TaxID=424218 RepID=A0A916J3G6_9PROT|nr:cytochrome c1 [Georgfuchsia toluolica]CAG4883897.1 Ammonia monooxygenase gamma subunit [Georgfuchsia toluolica]
MNLKQMNLKRLLLALLLAPFLSIAAPVKPAPEIHLDHAPDRSQDQKALQNGARIFTKYCLTCHSASLMRFNRLEEIGFTEQQIKEELMFDKGKIGEPMNVALWHADAKRWFGVVPPDHSLTVRARHSDLGPGEDWIYTYLRSFYRDPMRPSSWNNVVFPNVAMHHVLWKEQGEQVLGQDGKLQLLKPGKLTPDQYDIMVADLVAFLKYMSEPSAKQRRPLSIYVLIGMGVLLGFAIVLKPAGKKLRAPRRVA